MKLVMKAIGAAVLTVGAVLPAQAVMVGGFDVGSIDTLLGACPPGNSGDGTEAACLAGLGLGALTLSSQVTTFTLLSTGDFQAVNVSPATPGYYLLKFGCAGCGNSGVDSFVFTNLDNLNYLAWNYAALDTAYPAITSLSHYVNVGTSTSTTSTTGGGTSTGNVPEPGTGALALLGLGLLGAGFGLRRKQASSNT